jgi:hypothetical protein
VLLALGVVLAGGTWWWFERNFERQTRQVEQGQSAEARRNPFLAAERFLNRLGIDARSDVGTELLRSPPPISDMLIVDGLPPLSAGRREDLRRWLADGGEMLVEATEILEADDEPRPENFLGQFGAVLRADRLAHDEARAEILLQGLTEPIEVDFIARYYLEDGSGTAVGEALADDLPRLLQYAVGDGMLHVVSDSHWLSNAGIGELDHALLLARLASDRGTVWMLHSVAVPPLAVLVWRHAGAAVVSIALLIAGFLWYQGARLGPLLPEPEGGRRDLLEHLRAAGQLVWRLGRGGIAVRQTRRRIEQAWLRRHPPLRALGEAARAQRIAELNRLSPDEVHAALYGPLSNTKGRDRERLVWISAILQRLGRPQ